MLYRRAVGDEVVVLSSDVRPLAYALARMPLAGELLAAALPGESAEAAYARQDAAGDILRDLVSEWHLLDLDDEDGEVAA